MDGPGADRRESKLFERALRDAEGVFATPRSTHATASSGPTGGGGAIFSLPGYDVARLIGGGGQGSVFEAWHRASRRRVAIKVLSQGAMRRGERARFERELELVSGLDHPGVAAIRDSGEIGGSLYLVMDFVDGVPLDEWLGRAAPNDDQILRLFVSICEAVNAAHLRGVIHRDLKPANILIDSSGQPHVVDFGLARLRGEAGDAVVTLTGQFVGSLPWSSPEQARGSAKDLDLRSDVYALGVLLYHALVGAFPYPVSGTLREIVEHVCETEPTPLRVSRRASGRGAVQPDLEAVVLRCLQKERERRYQSAGELGRDLARCLAGEPVDARRDSRWYLVRRTVSRHRRPVALGAALMLLLASTTVVMTLLYREARDQAIRAGQATDAALESASRARAVVGALQGVLKSVDPVQMGRDTTEAVERIERESVGGVAGDPQLHAELRLAIAMGYTYNIDRNLRRATAGLARQIVALDRLALADPDEERLIRFQTEMLRARLEVRMAGPTAAAPIYERLVDAARVDAGLGPGALIDVQFSRALNFASIGLYEEAIECTQDALEVAERCFGRSSVPAAIARNQLIQWLVGGGKCDDALRRLEMWYAETTALIDADPLAYEYDHLAALWSWVLACGTCAEAKGCDSYRAELQAIFDRMVMELDSETDAARSHPSRSAPGADADQESEGRGSTEDRLLATPRRAP